MHATESRLAVALAAVLAAASAFVYLAAYPFRLFGDADWYRLGTSGLVGDGPLYPPSWLKPHVASRPPEFNQPPALALLSPIASAGTAVWGLFLAAALIGGLVILWPRLPGYGGLLLVCALVAWWPTWSALLWANINSLVFLLFAVAYRWPRHAGWALGAAAAFKAAPVLALAVIVGRRDWGQLLVALATGAGLTLLVALLAGPEVLWQFVQLQLNETKPPPPLGWSASDLVPGAVAIALALVLAGVSVWRGGSWAWAVAACLVFVPVLHLHYWIWALVPFLGWQGERTRAATPEPVATPG